VELLDAHPHIEVTGRSSVYETEPVGEVTEQRDFLNAVIAVTTPLEPLELLDACKEVESRLGRQAGGRRHGPRPIDVDVLMLGDLEFESERLTIPHPELRNRRFVTVPLAELAPELELSSGEAARVERVGRL
jgi:2-amino-4-hydroxy-6-hydroxymethyldihydropteridine diphosphokinase